MTVALPPGATIGRLRESKLTCVAGDVKRGLQPGHYV